MIIYLVSRPGSILLKNIWGSYPSIQLLLFSRSAQTLERIGEGLRNSRYTTFALISPVHCGVRCVRLTTQALPENIIRLARIQTNRNTTVFHTLTVVRPSRLLLGLQEAGTLHHPAPRVPLAAASVAVPPAVAAQPTVRECRAAVTR